MKISVKDINKNNWAYYFFNDIINIKDFGLDNIKKGKKPYKNILIYCIGYVRIKKDLKIYTVTPL